MPAGGFRGAAPPRPPHPYTPQQQQW
jgi:hypothetical protein